MMPILTTRPVTAVPATPPQAEGPPLAEPHHLRWLSALRRRFRRQVPRPLQRTDAQLTREANQRLQHEVGQVAGCQGLTAEVEQGAVTLFGSVDTTWRKERLAELVLTLPGVKQVSSHLLAEEEVSEQLQLRFQSLLTAGKIESLPRFLVEHRMVELYGEVTSPQRRSLLEREALAVPGVRVVLNHLRVPQESGTPTHTANR